jgi:hypothetical protein
MPGTLADNVLGWLILQPELLEKTDICAEDFEPGDRRRIFNEIQTLFQKFLVVDHAILAERLAPETPVSFVMGLTDDVPKTQLENFGFELRELRCIKFSKDLVRKSDELGNGHLKTGVFDRDGLAELKKLVAAHDALNGGRPADVLSALRTGAELQALDVRVEYAINKLIPDRALTLFHGRGGLGKTWIALQVAKAVSTGEDVFGLITKKRPVVYIDFENPLSIVVERVRRLDIQGVQFWTPTASPRPPRLDSDDYVFYKSLPAGALLIMDSLRSAYSGDENSSRDIGVVMGRLLELRDCGFTIWINHHTPKGNEKVYKGSTAISDLVDHVLSFYKVRPSNFEELDDDLGPMPGDTFFLGVRDKTRFEPFHVFLTFQEGGGFSVAEDPDADELAAIQDFIRTGGGGLTQTDIVVWAKGELQITKKGRLVSLLKKGESGGRWRSRKDGFRRIYGLL